MYSSTSLNQRLSSLALDPSPTTIKHRSVTNISEPYVVAYSYGGLYHSRPEDNLQQQEQHHRRRLSSTGEGSGDSSTTTSGSSSYGGEKESSSSEVGSEGRADSGTDVGRITGREEIEEELEEEVEENLCLAENERMQIENFYRGLKSQVFICNGLVNFYKKTITDATWRLAATGVPVVIFDGGEARARNKRRIQIILAERGTCFMLWQDIIDNLSSYKVDAPTFHTMHQSSDHNVQIGFSFDDRQAAEELWHHIEQLVACPENISLSVKGKKKRKKEKKPAKPAPLPPKSHISQPCCFVHVTSVDRNDRQRYGSLREFVPSTAFVPVRKPVAPDEY